MQASSERDRVAGPTTDIDRFEPELAEDVGDHRLDFRVCP